MGKLISLTAILFLSAADSYAALLGTERNWDFMQSVGGILIGKPELKENTWELPVDCNVSGLKEFSTKPTMLNSGLVWVDTEVRRKENIIYISIETALFGMGSKAASCGDADLGRIESGNYRVEYLSPDGSTNLIGEIEIPFKK